MSTQYTIGPNGPTAGSALTAIFPEGRPHDQVTLYNLGPAIAYLDDVSPINALGIGGQPLPVGSSVPWDQDRPLYVVSPTSTQITLSTNTQVGFDAGAIAGQLISQGLATDIAVAINAIGVPTVDRLTVLADVTYNAPGVNVGTFDVSGYQSVVIMHIQSSGFPGYEYIDLNWQDSNGVGLYNDAAITGAAPSGNTRIDAPVRGPKLTVSINDISSNAFHSRVLVYGSYKAKADFGYASQGAGLPVANTGSLDGQTSFGGCGVQTWSGSMAAGAQWAWQPDVVAGPAKLIFRWTTAGTVHEITRAPNALGTAGPFLLTTYLNDQNLATSAPTNIYYDIRLPAMPLEIQLTNAAASTVSTFRVTLVNGNPFSA